MPEPSLNQIRLPAHAAEPSIGRLPRRARCPVAMVTVSVAVLQPRSRDGLRQPLTQRPVTRLWAAVPQAALTGTAEVAVFLIISPLFLAVIFLAVHG